MRTQHVNPHLFLVVALGMIVAAGLGCGSRSASGRAGAGTVQATPASLPMAPPPTADQVRITLENAVKTAPGDPQTWLELALFYRNANDLRDAERALIACWRRFPHFPRAPYYLGLLYMTHGRDPDAVAPLHVAAALSPQDALVQVNAGLACLRTDRRNQALAYARAAIRIDPRVPDSYLLLARLYDHHGTANLALANLRTYLQYSPNPAPGDYLMGRIYARQADRDHALLWAQRAVQAAPDNAEFWLTLGRIYYELFNTAHAEDGIHCYQKALELNPNAWDTHLYLGRALVGQRRWEEAISHFQAALRTAEDTGPIYYDLGQALIKTGRTAEGQKALEEYNAYREFNEGIGKLRAAVAAAPQDPARHYALAQFCLRYRQYDQAIAALNEAVRKCGPDAASGRLMAEAEAGRAAARRAGQQRASTAQPDAGSLNLLFPTPNAQRPTPNAQSPGGVSPLLQGEPGYGR